jgi:hypothetical protein
MLGTTEELFAVALLLLWGSRKAGASTKKKETAAQHDADGEALLDRANQDAAMGWVDYFVNEGAPVDAADALARWAGIESSGNPRAVSSQGERGLMQLTHTTQQEGALTNTEWDELISPATTNQQHAHISMELVDWLWKKAMRYVDGGTALDGGKDPISTIWYAKLYHQRPVDVRDGHLHGPALAMARELAQRWKGDAQKMHYLRAANVVAFDNPDP